MADQITISSLNARGLGNKQKRRDVFDWLKKKSHSIYCIQDFHCTDSNKKLIEAEWGYTCIFSAYRSDSRGTAIMFNNNFEFTIHKSSSDPEGNFTAIDVELNKRRYTIITLYGPNTDKPDFYEGIKNVITGYENSSIIICGNWNLVQNFNIDTSGYRRENNIKAKGKVMELKEEYELVDPWRSNYPNLRRYTWRQKTPVKQSRLDFFLVSQDIYTETLKVDINPGYRTDHSLISLTLGSNISTRGKGFWKFNLSLLKDKKYAEMVKNCIKKVETQYRTPQSTDEDKQYTIDDQLIFEMIKLEIRGQTIKYCSELKRKRTEKENQLENQISNLEIVIQETPLQEKLEELEEKRITLEKIREDRVKALMISSKARWVEHGEKPTRYFCSLLKRNYVNKTITRLTVDNGDITDPKEILQEEAKYYEKLYSSKLDHASAVVAEEEFLKGENVKKLCDEDKESCESPLKRMKYYRV